MSPDVNKVSSRNMKRKNTQQENSVYGIRSDSFLKYQAVVKILKIYISRRYCITLTGISVM